MNVTTTYIVSNISMELLDINQGYAYLKEEVRDWLTETMGDKQQRPLRWRCRNDGTVMFFNENDATLFKLRWG